MLIKSVSLENVRSFLEKAELNFSHNITIIVGPNGGGKTNLLDTIVIVLRRYIFRAMYAAPNNLPDGSEIFDFRENDALNQMQIPKHSQGEHLPQQIKILLEFTATDLENMRIMKDESVRLTELSRKYFRNFPLQRSLDWNLDSLVVGSQHEFIIDNGNLLPPSTAETRYFLDYLQLYEIYGLLAERFEAGTLSWPMLFLPTSRAANGLNTSVHLYNFNEHDYKRQNDAVHSRSAPNISLLAIGRLAKRFREFQEQSNISAKDRFYADRNLVSLKSTLLELGYDWELVCLNAQTNHYDIKLKKQGTSFLPSGASSGEREILTYLLAIYALNIKDSLLVVDEPELHLHPSWQNKLYQIFKKLSADTGNQFVLATHSPTFISPDSVQYVSRVFSQNQRSRIRSLDAASLPDLKFLLSIVNSQNNEKVFFAEKVLLVEGILDRVFFEAAISRLQRNSALTNTVEVIDVGGKGFFSQYKKLLESAGVKHSIVADLDYLIDIHGDKAKSLFHVEDKAVRDALKKPGSKDAKSFVANVEQAISTGNWGSANEVWEYIKSRHRKLRDDLSEESTVEITKLVNELKAHSVFLLEDGDLEAYLPPEFASKELGKLVEFVRQENFWSKLPAGAGDKIDEILQAVIDS